MIDYQLVGRALGFYTAKGFQQVEVPWLVKPAADAMTRPVGVLPMKTNGDLCLPGSGEQGFIQLMQDNTLPRGDYVTVTPCFRTEVEHNQYTRPWFLKVELIAVDRAMTMSMIQVAEQFFRMEGLRTCRVQTAEGWDLVSSNDIELGSYGHRCLGDTVWTYGTGLAEPRTSAVLHESSVARGRF